MSEAPFVLGRRTNVGSNLVEWVARCRSPSPSTRRSRVPIPSGAQYPPITGADPVGQLHAQAAEIQRESTDLELVVFPEIHLCGDCDIAADSNEWLRSAAEPLDGPRVRALGEAAGALEMWLIPGSVPELGDGGHVYNTQVVFDPSGNLVASYRKVFPWRPYEAWSSGHEFAVFDMSGTGRAGLSICYDAWFPESTRSVAWFGAEFVVNVVKTIGADRKQERVLAQANAIVNQVFMLSVNAAGPIGTGGSIVCDPEGTVIGDLPTAEPGVLRVDARPGRGDPGARGRHGRLQPDVVADGARRSGDRPTDLSGPDRSDPVATERSVMTASEDHASPGSRTSRHAAEAAESAIPGAVRPRLHDADHRPRHLRRHRRAV